MRTILRFVLAALCSAPLALFAQDKGKAKAPDAKEAAKAAPQVEYNAPVRGAPRVRVGGGTRGDARELSLAVIAPDHTGLASTEQPEFYWYVSQAVRSPLEFTITALDAIDPLLEKPVPAVAQAGIQRVRLADFGIRLKPGTEYQWSISFVADPASRSKDIVAIGRIRVVAPPADLPRSVAEAGPARAFSAYARAGYWYDAVASLRGELSRHPGDAALLNAQQSLFEQVGLAEIARQAAH